MAGDWIKMRGNLWHDPRVSALCDATQQSEAAVIGAMYWLWSTADQHSEDGFLAGISLRAIDRNTGVSGFGDAMVGIGWLAVADGGINIVRFDDHNGTSAKRRCSESRRKMSARDADNERTDSGQPPEEPQHSCAPRVREEKSKPKNTAAAAASEPPKPEKPENPPPPLSADSERAKTLAARFDMLESGRGRASKTYAQHPGVAAWVKTGVADPEFREAYGRAAFRREQDGDSSPINAKFLLRFIEEVIAESKVPVGQVVSRAWHESASGIEAKGRELGIPLPSPETGGFPPFKARVFAAAGMAA